MAELADAHGSGPCESNFMQVQVLLPAPCRSKVRFAPFFSLEGDVDMEYAFSILMFCFSGMILLYAGIMAATKDINMLRWRHVRVAKMNDPKAYAVMVAKILALTAAAPLAGGLAGLISPSVGGIVLVIAFILFIWLGVKLFYYDA